MTTSFEELTLTTYPYPGLRPFQRKESDIFFGREEQVDQILNKLERSRFVAVIGPSGCGKSSLVRAGVIPALEGGFLSSAGFRWRTATIRPGRTPLRSLAKELLACGLFEAASEDPEEDASFLEATLGRGPLGLIDALHDSNLEERENLLLLVDQFEELFRFERLREPGEARAFVDLLLATTRQPNIGAYVIITMRSDFLGQCPIFAGLPEAMNDSQFLTPRLSRDQTRAAIEGPLAMFNASIDDLVVNRIVNQMGSNPDHLPLMQHLLMQMWKLVRPAEGDVPPDALPAVRLTMDHYDAAGKLQNALEKHVQRVYDDLGERQPIAESVFRCLTEITPDDKKVRRPATLREICETGRITPAEAIEVIEQFRLEGRSFLAPPPPEPLSQESTVDISHEKLISQWKLLEEWTTDQDRSRKIAAKVREAAKLWQQQQKRREAVLKGLGLEEALDWSNKHAAELDPIIREFLEASQRERESEIRRDEALKYTKELESKSASLAEANKKLGDTNAKLAKAHQRLLSSFRWIMGLAGLAFILCLVVLVLWRQAESGRREVVEQKDTVDRQNDDLRKKGDELQQEGDRLRITSSMEQQQRFLALADDYAGQDRTRVERELPSRRLLLVSQAMKQFLETQYTMPQADSDSGLQSVKTMVEGAFRDAIAVFCQRGIETVACPTHHAGILALERSRDGQWLATGSADKTARIWSAPASPGADPQLEREIPHEFEVTALALDTSRNPRFATGTSTGQVRLWRDWRKADDDGEVLDGHRSGIVDMEFGRSGEDVANPGAARWLVTSDDNGRVWLWDLDQRPAVGRELKGHEGRVSDVAISGDNHWLATASWDGTARVWDLLAEYPEKSSAVSAKHRDWVNDVAFSPDMRWLATASDDRSFCLFDLSTAEGSLENIQKCLEQPRTRGEATSGVLSLVFDPDGRFLVLGASDGTVHIRKMDAPEADFQQFSADRPVRRVEFGRGKNRAWMAYIQDGDQRVYVRAVTSDGVGADVTSLCGHEGEVRNLRFLPTDATSGTEAVLASSDDQGICRLWYLGGENSLISQELVSSGSPEIFHASFSTDAHRLTFVANVPQTESRWQVDSKLQVWSIPPDTEPSRLNWTVPFDVRYSTLEVSPDGRWCVVARNTEEVWLHDAQREEPRAVRVGLPSAGNVGGRVSSEVRLRFSPDSRWLACTSGSRIFIWALPSTDLSKPGWSWDVAESRDVELLHFDADGHRLIYSDSSGRTWTRALLPDAEAKELRLATRSRTLAIGAGKSAIGMSLVAASFEDGRVSIWQADKLFDASRPSVKSSGENSIQPGHPSRGAKGGESLTLGDAITQFQAEMRTRITSLAFSAGGKWLVGRSWDGRTYLWNVAGDGTARPEPVTIAAKELMTAFGVSPDDQYLVSGHNSGTILVWRLTDAAGELRRPQRRLIAHERPVLAIGFRDDATFATVAEDGSARSWSVSADEEFNLDQAGRLVGRNPTREEWLEMMRTENYPRLAPSLPIHHDVLSWAGEPARQEQEDPEGLKASQARFERLGYSENEARVEALAIANLSRGHRAVEQGDLDQARKFFEAARHSKTVGMTNPLRAAEAAKREYDRARGEELLREAVVLAERGEIQESLETAKEAHRLGADLDIPAGKEVEFFGAAALALQSRHLVRQGQVEEALRLQQELTAKFPDMVERWSAGFEFREQAARYAEQGRQLWQEGDPAGAEKAFFTARQLDPAFNADSIKAELLLEEARRLAESDKIDESVECLKQARELGASLPFAEGEERNWAAAAAIAAAGLKLIDQDRLSEAAKMEASLKNDYPQLADQFSLEFVLSNGIGRVIEEGKRLSREGNLEQAQAKFSAVQGLPEFDARLSGELRNVENEIQQRIANRLATGESWNNEDSDWIRDLVRAFRLWGSDLNIDADAYADQSQVRWYLRAGRQLIEQGVALAESPTLESTNPDPADAPTQTPDDVEAGSTSPLWFDQAKSHFQRAKQLDVSLRLDPAKYTDLLIGRAMLDRARALTGVASADEAQSWFDEGQRRLLASQAEDPFGRLAFNPRAEALRSSIMPQRIEFDTEFSTLLGGLADDLRTNQLSPADALLLLSEIGRVQAANPAFNFPARVFNGEAWYRCLLDPQHADQHLPLARAAVELAPEHWSYRDTLGVALALTGDIDKAIEEFRSFVAWSPAVDQRRERQGWIDQLQRMSEIQDIDERKREVRQHVFTDDVLTHLIGQ